MTTPDRVLTARADISRRRLLAETAKHHDPPRNEQEIRESLTRFTRIRPPDVAHIAAVTPLAYSVAVLDLADSILDRHSLADWYDELDDSPRECASCSYDDRRIPWPCPDASVVLDAYAPEPAANPRAMGIARPAAEAAPADRVVPPVGAASSGATA